MALFMGAIQFKVSLLIMIKAPDLPVILVMAQATIGTQTLLVHIVLVMAAITFELGILIRFGDMAILTRSEGMQAQERKAGYVMIKCQFFLPSALVMTDITLLAFLPLMDIIRLVAANAGRVEIGIDIRAMTCKAVRLGMTAKQLVVGILVVIEFYLIPLFFFMTIFAFFPKSAAVKIVRLVTGHTFFL